MSEIHLTDSTQVPPNPFDFSDHPELTLTDLLRVQDACVIYENMRVDSDGVRAYLYTVGGYLDGKPLWPGHTVAGDVLIAHGKSRRESDDIAANALRDTIKLLAEKGVDPGPNAGILTSASRRARR